MKHNILNYFNKSNEAFIHPKGEVGSDFMFSKMKLLDDETILEFGFGTGASLIKALSYNNNINLFGIEKSKLMLEKTKARLRFCKVKNHVELKLLKTGNLIPFESSFFDKIYVESVLAIQEGEKLPEIISELHRILKPNGKIYINELLWSSKTEKQSIKIINQLAKDQFGIIQSNEEYSYISDWLSLFEKKGFNILDSQNIDNISNETINFMNNKAQKLSHLFSLLGKIRKKMLPNLRNEWKYYESVMNSIDVPYKLEPYMIVAKKHSSSIKKSK